MIRIAELLSLIDDEGGDQYGREAVTQREHALQCAMLAEADGAAPTLVAAALLHDLGHLLYRSDKTGFGQERDDRHEQIAAGVLLKLFGPAVAEPVRLHVDAKRWLCTVELDYFATLSPASVRSLELQGGIFTPTQAAAFSGRPYAEDSVRLRRWDDCAKVPGTATRTVRDYAELLRALAI